MSRVSVPFRTFALLLLPTAAFAHPGHFENAPMAHAFWHAGLALLALVVIIFRMVPAVGRALRATRARR